MVIFLKVVMFQISLTKNTSRLSDYFIGDVIWCMVDTRMGAKKRREKEERRCRFICNFCGWHIKIVLEMRLLNAQIVVHLMNVRPLVTSSIIFC